MACRSAALAWPAMAVSRTPNIRLAQELTSTGQAWRRISLTYMLGLPVDVAGVFTDGQRAGGGTFHGDPRRACLPTVRLLHRSRLLFHRLRFAARFAARSGSKIGRAHV